MEAVGSAALALALAAAQTAAPAVGQLVEGLRCESDPTQSYTLYLPAAYTKERAWPALLVFDPGGRSRVAAEVFREAAERHGWILLSSNDTRNGAPPEQNLRALKAMWPEAHLRYATDSRRVYAAGFSAGGMLAYELGRRTPGENGLAGVIASGARWDPHHFKQEIRFPCFGAAGDTDFNYARMRDVHARLREWGTEERLEIFEGAHEWMPATLAAEAVAWMELLAIKGGLRKGDAGFVAAQLQADLERARALEARGAPLAALRTLEQVAATFEGLAPVEGARRELARLGALPALQAARRAESHWDRYEESWLRQLGNAYAQLLGVDPPLTAAAFRAAVRIDDLRQQAAADGYEGVVGAPAARDARQPDRLLHGARSHGEEGPPARAGRARRRDGGGTVASHPLVQPRLCAGPRRGAPRSDRLARAGGRRRVRRSRPDGLRRGPGLAARGRALPGAHARGLGALSPP